MKKISLVLVVLLCSGCAFAARSYNEKDVEQLTLHMSKEEVMTRMGRPSSAKVLTIEGQEYEVWQYPIERYFARRYNALDTSYYEVLFSEGTVAQWRRVKLYAQPDHDLRDLPPEGTVVTVEFLKGRYTE